MAVTRLESFRRWGHLTWPGDMTLGDLDLQFSGKFRNSCPNSCAKKTVALHGLVKAHYWEQKTKQNKNVQPIPKQHRRKCGAHEETWRVETPVLFPEVIKGSMPPCIDHMELLAWMQRADFSEHIQRFKLHGNPLNFPHFDAPNTKFAPTGYRRAPNIISHLYKQQLSAKASIIPKARPIRFR